MWCLVAAEGPTSFFSFLFLSRLKSSADLGHGHLLAVFGMVAAKRDVLQLEEVIALVTLKRTQRWMF